jgi:hypothetical protein
MTILNERPADPGQLLLQWIGYGLSAIASLMIVLPVGRGQDWLSVLLLVAPVVLFALLLYAPQAFVMTTRRSQTRMLNVLMAGPAFCLVVVAFGAGVLDVRYAFAPAGLCAAIALLLGLALAARRLPGHLLTGLVFSGVYGAAYGYGAMIFADTRLDHADGQTFQSQVVRRYIGGGRSMTYRVVLTPWGPVARQDDVTVSRALYHQTQEGQTLCVTLHPGLLRMPWRSVAACPTA